MSFSETNALAYFFIINSDEDNKLERLTMSIFYASLLPDNKAGAKLSMGKLVPFSKYKRCSLFSFTVCDEHAAEVFIIFSNRGSA